MFFDKLKTDILNDKPEKSVLFLAIPVVILNLLKSGNNIVDMLWLGRLGGDFLAGVSASIFLVWAMGALSSLVTTGIIAGVSRNVGEGNLKKARSNSFFSLKISIFMGIFFSLIFFPFISPLVKIIGLDSVAFKAGVEYLKVMIGSNVLLFLLFSLHSILIAWGDTIFPLKVYGIVFILNVILTPVLMFGIGPFPKMETSGTALATNISYLLGIIIFFKTILKRKWISFNISYKSLTFLQYLKLGYPSAISGLFFSLIYYFIAKIVAMFGTAPVAAMGIGHKIESVSYFLSMGLASGLSAFVGQNLGKKQFNRVENATFFAIKSVGVIILLYSIIVFVFAKYFVLIFTNDAKIIIETVRYLKIIMLAETFQAILIVIESGAFAGAGFTTPTFFISFSLTIIRVPIAWFFAVFLGMNVSGVWITIALIMFLESLIFLYLLKQNKWIKKII
jgi:putative MATE family efflux protein